MAQDVDELFGGGQGQPAPRTGLVGALLVGGLLLSIVGLACSSVPGGILVLIAWSVVETENDRIESGYLPLDARGRVRALRAAVYFAIVVVVAALAVQLWLLGQGFYQILWSSLLELVLP